MALRAGNDLPRRSSVTHLSSLTLHEHTAEDDAVCSASSNDSENFHSDFVDLVSYYELSSTQRSLDQSFYYLCIDLQDRFSSRPDTRPRIHFFITRILRLLYESKIIIQELMDVIKVEESLHTGTSPQSDQELELPAISLNEAIESSNGDLKFMVNVGCHFTRKSRPLGIVFDHFSCLTLSFFA